MSIQIAINHKTEYRFDRPVGLSPHVVRLRPAPHSRTPILSYSLRVEPKTHFINWQQDPFGNYLARLVFPEKATHLSVEVEVIAELVTINPFDFFLEEYADFCPFEYDAQLTKELSPYLEIKEDGPLLNAWLAQVDRSRTRTVDFLVALNQRLQGDIGYTIRMETGIQTCEETLEKALGSCRDSAWVLVQILRHLGLAARFVSGYLVQLTADQKSLDGPSGPEADFTDLHAWAEVYVPGAGWIGLDPTSGLFAGEGHIPLACTPDPVSAAPITGAMEPCEVEFYFHNQVTRIHEDPRVTKPYTEEQWRAIEALGHQVDRDLLEHDVRLTMGGEPTFVSIDDMDGAEWNIAAMGPTKKGLSEQLIKRLKGHFAPGGLLHIGQGKWYPGEQLPRWALSCFWRADGEPVWRDPRLLAEERESYGHTAAQAEAFIRTLAQHLGVRAEFALPAHEDVFYYLWKEARLPGNVDPLDSKLKDPLERARIARIFEQGLNSVVGYVLPLCWQGLHPNGRWLSGRWSFRDGNLFLIPGDSPMGFRLPLDALPYIPEGLLDTNPERNPFEPRGPLGQTLDEVSIRYSEYRPSGPEPHGIREQHAYPGTPSLRYTRFSETAAEAAAHQEQRDQQLREQLHLTEDEWASRVRTALCVEPRDGRLYVFMPPLTHLEHWLDLVACIEATAASLKTPVVLEGYEPPKDHRLRKLAVTPDPGVIEVNIQPAYAWDELVRDTHILYEEARLCRLGTEKFMLDGRHTGTGGGNHVTLGGPTPADSPLLRRPDLVQSLITFWQHHPSLSYLLLGVVHRPHQPGPAGGRGARRRPLQPGDRLPADAPWGTWARGVAALDRGPGAAQPAL